MHETQYFGNFHATRAVMVNEPMQPFRNSIWRLAQPEWLVSFPLL